MFYKHKKIIKKYCQPEKSFLKESKLLFIQELKKNNIVIKKDPARINIWKGAIGYSLAALGLAVFFSGGTIAFAEMKNVPAQHPLYQAKRLGEKIQTTVSPKTTKVDLYDKFAQRRLEEIKQIKLEIDEQKIIEATSSSKESIANATSATEKKEAIVESLNKDFHREINSVLDTIESPKPTSSAPIPQKTCSSISKKIKEHRQILNEEDEEDWQNFRDKCPNQEAYTPKRETNKNKEEVKNEQQKNESVQREQNDEQAHDEKGREEED